MTLPRNIAIRDQLAAAIKAADVPISTLQLALSAPPVLSQQPCHPRLHWLSGPLIFHTHCDGITHRVWRRPMPPEIYPLLRQLEGRGQVERWRVNADPRVFWVWTAGPGIPLEQLERIWNTPPTEKEHH